MTSALLDRVKRIARALAIVCGAYVLGFIVGKRDHEPPRAAEPPAPAIRHEEGSLTLERVNKPAPPPLPEPDQTRARVRSAVIEMAATAAPAKLQVDVLEMKDGTERITVKGDGVVITGGQDFALPPRPRVPVHKWTVGGGVGVKNYTMMGLRSFGPVEVGALLQRDRRDSRAWDAQIIALWRF